MNESDAKLIVAELAAAFPSANISQATVNVYAKDLADLDAVRARAAVEVIRRTATFFPTIAEIRREYAIETLGAPSSETAWLQTQLDRADRHPLVQKARRMVGSDWDWREGRSSDLYQRFRRAYAEVFRAAILEIQAPGAEPRLAIEASLDSPAVEIEP